MDAAVTLRNYSNNAIIINLTAAIDAVTTVLPVTSTASMPAVPFIGVLERGQPIQEVVLVTAKTANSMTVTRGYDGSPASSHGSTAIFEHAAAAIEYREANAHINDKTLHYASYPTAGLPSSGNVEGQVVYDSTVAHHKYWTGTFWTPTPGTLLGIGEVTSDRAPVATVSPVTPAGCTFPFTMPQLPANRRVRLEWNCRNLWYDRGDRHELVKVEILRNSNNARLAARHAMSDSHGGDKNNNGIYVVGFLDNGDVPAGTETVKLTLWVNDGGIGFEAGPEYPATFTAMVV